jgi:cytoskeletal protein CcmA (bactofilin family)
VNIGKSVIIKGELNGSEDLTIEGLVEGKIELRQNVLTIGPNGKIKAQVFAKSVIILGEVTGNVTATEKVDIRDNGSVDGDIAAPRVAIAEGAHFRGSIDMQRTGAKAGESKPAETGRSRSQRPPRRPRRPRRNPRRLPRRGSASGNQRLTNTARGSRRSGSGEFLAHSRVLNDLRHAH